ncbi:hypothetical protein CRG98_009436 [Punica granatum]|uniref:Retroviral polymerase SH3-like domain-containing protein n=1 Tax=Punica granatum TaxID=22663 RepID=A0A2I0KQV3_PUNGR|nr:hypothetical protein CRG98_009436 [Punica granatum]
MEVPGAGNNINQRRPETSVHGHSIPTIHNRMQLKRGDAGVGGRRGRFHSPANGWAFSIVSGIVYEAVVEDEGRTKGVGATRFEALRKKKEGGRASDKFEERSRKCMFVGYPNEKKGWRLYDIKSREFFVLRDVYFCEDVFQFTEINKAEGEDVLGSQIQPQ